MSGKASYSDMEFVSATSTPERDVLADLRAAWQSERPIGIEIRFLLMDAHDKIERLERQLEIAKRPWWFKFWI